ncbi:MAG: type II secretion system protein GspC [Gammaproteobacteria bacterium]|nr:type II secretion system protein GspC [Gammaproteobacteria bacterium]
MKLQTLKLSNPQMLKLFQHYVPPALSIILLISASYTLAQITWLLLEPAPTIEQSAVRPVNSKQTTDNNGQFQQKLLQLNNAHLFGQTNSPAVKQASKDAPETTLNLVLRGILSAQPMNLASAIITSGKQGQELIYSVGDSVPGNATVEEIYPAHIILMRNGRLETLKLPEKSIGETLSDSPSQTNDLNTNQTSDRILGDIRRDIMKNPTSFGEYAIPVPVSKNGKLQGYRLRPQKKGRELFEQFGIQRNDIVTEVNGISLNDPVQSMAALRKLSTASSINMTVMRNGVATPLQFNIR